MNVPAVCRNCGFEIAPDADPCPHCGEEEPRLTDRDRKRKKRWGLGECLLAALVVAGLLLGLAWLGYRLCRWLPAAIEEFLG